MQSPSEVRSRSERWWIKRAQLFFSGFAMGAADVVPGVSGGTIAFILGIYEELIASIKTFTGEVLGLVLKLRLAEAIRIAPFPFIIPLLLGILIAVVSLANLVSWLLDEHPVHLWAFFFGLVGASILVVGRRVRSWSLPGVGCFLLAAGGAYLLVGVAPAETPDTPIWFFASGAIAICAMILPGISGSFILILLGKYDQVLDAVVDRDVLTIGIFLVGAVAGIALFSRVLSWLFTRYHDLMMLALAGLMLGSLRKVWPWKETISTRIDRHGMEVAAQEANILPDALDGSLALAVLLCVIGAALVLVLGRLDPTGSSES